MVGILSTLTVLAAVEEACGVNIPMLENNPMRMRGGNYGNKLEEMGIPNGIPQAIAGVALMILAKRQLNKYKMNPGIKISKRERLTLV